MLRKVKSCFPSNLYAIIKSYLLQRTFRIKYGEAVTQLKEINSGSLQGKRDRTDTLFAIHRRSSSCPGYHNCDLCGRHSYSGGSQQLYRSIPAFTRKLYILHSLLHSKVAKEMENQPVQVTFITRRDTCPAITLNSLKIPQAEDAKYLELHLDRRLNWRKHIFTKQKNNLEFNQARCKMPAAR